MGRPKGSKNKPKVDEEIPRKRALQDDGARLGVYGDFPGGMGYRDVATISLHDDLMIISKEEFSRLCGIEQAWKNLEALAKDQS